MKTKRFVKVVPFAVALGLSSTVGAIAAPASDATSLQPAAAMHSTAMEVTKTGTFVKLLSMTTFRMTVDMKPYVVKVDAMTHITLGGMKTHLATLKKGDTVTVKGVLEMGTILATTVKAGM